MAENLITKSRVIICDDEKPIRVMLSRLLSYYGCKNIFSVTEGSEAVEAVKNESIDLVIMDINLGGKTDGITIASRIKMISDIPVIYVTGNLNDDNFNRIKETRPAAIIEKPFNGRFLIYTLEIALYNYKTLMNVESRYKKITEAITDYIYSVKLNNNKAVETVHGPMCEKITGYSTEEFSNDPFLWYKIIYKKDSKRVSEYFTNIIEKKNQNSLDIEHRIVKKDGTVIWVKNSTVFHYDYEGNALSYDGVVSDITQRKELEEALSEKNNELLLFNRQLAEKIMEKTRELEKAYKDLKDENTIQKEISEALRESRTRFFELANFLPEITFEMDDNGIMTFVNENGVKKLGYENDEVKGFIGLNILAPEDREKAAINILRVLNGEDVGANSYTILKKDGSCFPALFHSQHYINESGDSVIRGIVVDITAQKSIEDQLRQSRKAIEDSLEKTERELNEAGRIHSMLLPLNLPENSLVNVSFRYEPYVMVGGDYFSFYNLKEIDGIGIFIGDVSGHGVSAALFTSLIKTNTDYVCRDLGTKPSEYLAKLNSILYHNLNDHFLTGIYGYFKKEDDGKVYFTFSNAGHPELVIYKKHSGKVLSYRPAGRVLGIKKQCLYEEVKLPLDSGDRVFLYTDGLIETTNENEMMISEKDFLEIIRKNNLEKDLDSVLESIMMDISLFRKGADIIDDMLVVGFEVL